MELLELGIEPRHLDWKSSSLPLTYSSIYQKLIDKYKNIKTHLPRIEHGISFLLERMFATNNTNAGGGVNESLTIS